jgi:hypothetical protein
VIEPGFRRVRMPVDDRDASHARRVCPSDEALRNEAS